MSKESGRKFVEMLKARKPAQAVIGLVFSESSTDEHETKYSVRFRENLSGFGTGCQGKLLDFHAIINKFKAENPNTYQKMLAERPPRPEINGVIHAPNLDVTKGAGKIFKDYLAQLPEIQALSGIAGPGDHYNVLGERVNASPHRMYFEKALYTIAKEKGIPVLGVCGTEQHIAYFAGAAISQDVEQLSGYSHVGRNSEGKADGDVLQHDILITPGSMVQGALWKAEDISKVKVNSLHHQGVINNPTSHVALQKENYEIVAVDPTKTVVEGIESIFGAPMVLLQSHPEYLNGAFEKNVMSAFVQAAAAYAGKKTLMDGVEKTLQLQPVENKRPYQEIARHIVHGEQFREDRACKKSFQALLGELVTPFSESIAQKKSAGGVSNVSRPPHTRAF